MRTSARWQHAKAVFGWWWLSVNAAWGCLTAADTLVSKWASESFRRAWDSYWRLPKWGWKVWVIGFLLITLICAFEASYRIVRDASEKHIRAEQQLAEEKANKLSVDEIVLREARKEFRNLTPLRNSTISPRAILNSAWITQTAGRHDKTIAEIDAAIDRLDGQFHWQKTGN